MATRRTFLKAAPSLLTLEAMSPRFWLQAAESSGSNSDGRILVVVQLSGGNDGLNTVIPFDRDEYRKARPTLAVPKDDVLKMEDHWGFHPEMTGFADLYQNGQLSIVQGVGYPNPNRSHFESMDIWHSCTRQKDRRSEGWLGRCAAECLSAADVPAIHLGQEQQPLALSSTRLAVPSIKSLDQFRLQGAPTEKLVMAVESPPAVENGLLSFVQSSTSTALRVSERIQQQAKSYQSTVEYPDSQLAQKLKAIAGLVHADLGTRIYYVQLDGFDTHSQQAGAHAGLLRQWTGAVAAFLKDLESHQLDDRVTVMSFSEFGRRLEENASEGTDHGAAAPLFLAGKQLNSGLIGELPSLTDLDQGDLKFQIDFRQVYASLLEDWLGCDSARILGKDYKKIPVFHKT